MIKEYCDRCGLDVTDLRTGAVSGRRLRDNGGTKTDHFDILCLKCYRAIVAFIKTPPPTKAPSKRSAGVRK